MVSLTHSYFIGDEYGNYDFDEEVNDNFETNQEQEQDNQVDLNEYKDIHEKQKITTQANFFEDSIEKKSVEIKRQDVVQGLSKLKESNNTHPNFIYFLCLGNQTSFKQNVNVSTKKNKMNFFDNSIDQNPISKAPQDVIQSRLDFTTKTNTHVNQGNLTTTSNCNIGISKGK